MWEPFVACPFGNTFDLFNISDMTFFPYDFFSHDNMLV